MPKIVNYVGNTYHNAHGDYTVIEDLGLIHRRPDGRMTRMLRVQFHDSGNIYDVLPESISTKDGVKDKLADKILGKYTFGPVPEYYNDKAYNKEYLLWYHVISLYEGIGIPVCRRWKNFGKFLTDIITLDNYKEWKASNDYTFCLKSGCREINIDSVYFGYACGNTESYNIYDDVYRYSNNSFAVDVNGFVATFNNPYYAYIYKNMYDRAIPANNRTVNDFINAQHHRTNFVPSEGYKTMYHLIVPD